MCTAEQHNSDWWFVRKYLTQERGLVPAHLLQDEPNYTAHVQKRVHQKIDKLPVFESKCLWKPVGVSVCVSLTIFFILN